MSRVAKLPIIIPNEVEVTLKGKFVSIKGKKGILNITINKLINVKYYNNKLTFIPYINNKKNWAIAGTMRALLNNMVIGVNKGFKKKLQLVGVGYRAYIKGKFINLSLGFSHIIKYELPIGIIADCPIPTEIIIKGSDKQLIGQIAADLRSYRSPDPYKGKGICYNGEFIRTKEAKKK